MSHQNHFDIKKTDAHVLIQFAENRRVLSSAVFNGGFVTANRILNLRVDLNGGHERVCESPQETLKNYCQKNKINGQTVGMMTAASMKTCQISRRVKNDVEVVSVVTSGLSNALRAGDRASYQECDKTFYEVGTINTILITNVMLTEAACAEAIMIATEAKVAVLEDLDIVSVVSHKQATGTGTDSVAIVNGLGPKQLVYCGKHLLFGEMIASTVIEALKQSLEIAQVLTL